LHGALDAPLTGGVRVGLRLVDGRLRRHRSAPDLCEADEEPLVGGVAVALAVHVTGLGLGLALVGDGLHQRLVRDADACVVGGVLAERQVTVQVLSGSHFEAVILLRVALAAFLELLQVIGVNQLRWLPAGSYCDPWSSKPCVISWPITTPIPPKFTGASTEASKNGGCRIPAGKLMLFCCGL